MLFGGEAARVGTARWATAWRYKRTGWLQNAAGNMQPDKSFVPVHSGCRTKRKKCSWLGYFLAVVGDEEHQSLHVFALTCCIFLQAEKLNGRACMVGYFLALLVEKITGAGLADQQGSFLGLLSLHIVVFAVLLFPTVDRIQVTVARKHLPSLSWGHTAAQRVQARPCTLLLQKGIFVCRCLHLSTSPTLSAKSYTIGYTPAPRLPFSTINTCMLPVACRRSPPCSRRLRSMTGAP